jgi:uncharacterized protein (TIGR04255 family)
LSDDLPNKLKHDAIVEAVFDIRFEPESSLVPEIFFGRLADTSEWKGFTQRRLPSADIPAVMRRADPNLRYQPALELVDLENKKVVQMGPYSLVLVRRAPYPGWTESFGAEVGRTIDRLFEVAPGIPVVRLGLRYVNALRSDIHGIAGIESLNLTVLVDEASLTRRLNLNYHVSVSDDSTCTVRVATTDFASGGIPENTTAIIDVDVYTTDNYRTSDATAVKDWTERAHIAEKKNFFRLLKRETINALRES